MYTTFCVSQIKNWSNLPNDSIKTILKSYSDKELIKHIANITILNNHAISTNNLELTAYTYNKLGEIKGIIGNYNLSKEYYKKSILINLKLNNDLEIAKLNNLIGMNHIRLFNNDSASVYFLKSFKIYENQKNYKGLADSYHNIGVYYLTQNKFNDALKYLLVAEKNYKKTEFQYLSNIYNDIGVVYSALKNYPVAENFLNKALIYAKKNKPKSASFSYGQLGANYYKTGQKEKGIRTIYKAIKIADKHNLKQVKLINLFNLIEMYMESKRFNECEKTINEALQICNDLKAPHYRVEVYRYKMELNKAKKNYKKAITFFEKYVATKDSLELLKNKKEISKLYIKFETEEKEKEIFELQKEKISQKKITLRNNIIYGLSLLMLLFTITLLKIRYNKQREIDKKNKTIIEQESTYKSKQLTTYSLNLIQKNNMLNELKTEINKLHNINSQDLNTQINHINRMIKTNLNIEKDWSVFKLYFEEVNKDFYKKLQIKYTQLKPGDLKLAALIKLNLSIKETSNILNLSVSSVKNSRYRLRKKLNLNKTHNLAKFLMNL